MSTVDLRDVDLRRLLHAAGELSELDATADPPVDVAGLLRLVATLVECDTVSWSRLDLTTRQILAGVTAPDEDAAGLDEMDPVFWATYHEHPLCHGRGATLPVVAVSDLLTRQGWHRNAVYNEYLRPLGAEHLLKVDLQHPRDQTNVLLLDRARGRGFDDRDRLVLTLLRPHLDAALRRFEAPARRLTAREREILTLVRDGLTNHAIGSRLGISTHTVRKHLENVFARLGVHSRTAAVAVLAEPTR